MCEIAPFCSSNPCQNGATCTNTGAGTGTCTNCPLGYAGQFCEKVLTGCGTPNVDCAVAHTTAYNSNIPNNRQKTCPCRDQSTCASSGSGVTFLNDPFGTQGCQCNSNAFDCRCNSTYVSKCPSQSPSVAGVNVDMVCSNGGTCAETPEGTLCQCRPGFWGPSCENYDNPCLNNPCKNGGRCGIVAETSNFWVGGYGAVRPTIALDDRFWGYMCTCKWPYYGDNCELVAPRDPVVCTNNECQNGATCGPMNYDSSRGNIYQFVGNFRQVGLTYTCQCNANYTGIRCETPKVTCANSPNYCQNGGNCVAVGGAVDGSRPGCICPCGFAGDRCELQASNSDRNSLLMLSNVNGGVGYRLDFCSNAPCQNGGTCYNSMNGQGFLCICKSGWGDRYCQTKVRSAAAGVVPSLFAVAAAVAVALALKN
jgi:hypothetical protein